MDSMCILVIVILHFTSGNSLFYKLKYCILQVAILYITSKVLNFTS